MTTNSYAAHIFKFSLFDFLSQVGKALILPFLPIILGGDCTTTGDDSLLMQLVNGRIETHDVNVTKQVNRRDRGALM
eukprot:scaffold5281_cov115-Skeletonema_marinoi.AAC.6